MFQTVFFLDLGSWICCGILNVNWGFQVDSLSIIMLGLVSVVSTSLLSLFTFFMFVLITSDNFLVLFFGWEGIGICSFLLISFWQTRLSATKAALKAIILNRIGDSAFIAAIAFLYLLFKSLDFSVIFGLIPFMVDQNFSFLCFDVSYIEFISFLFVIGAVGKSAQLGLHGWLPEAMEGPTPVSALIHAATLVTAGVFLLIRCSYIIEYAPFTLNFILMLGGLTCIFGSTIACAQNDLKRIIAFSTTSQLGYMFFACGLSAYNVALFHLLNHGFFKALLFLCAGSVIYVMSHEQDIRKLGSLVIFLPFIYSAFVISLLALVGFPFLSGFYSKEVIIEISFSSYKINSFYIYFISSISALLTSYYGFRCLYLSFLSFNNSYKNYLQNILIIKTSILFSLFILVLGSIFSGLWFKDVLIGLGSCFFDSSIHISSLHFNNDTEYISLDIKYLPLLGTYYGFLIAIFLNRFYGYYFVTSIFDSNSLVLSNKDIRSPFLFFVFSLKTFLSYKWFLDFVQNNYFAFFVLKHSYETCYKIIDKGVLEICIINNLSFSVTRLAYRLVLIQNGYIYSTLCILVLFFTLLLQIIIL